MKKQERADLVRQRLGELYPDPTIPLDHRDEFTLLVAVLLSAQCTDKKVNEVTPESVPRRPDARQDAAIGRGQDLGNHPSARTVETESQESGRTFVDSGRGTWRSRSADVRAVGSIARCRPQDSQRGDGSSVWRAGFSGRYAHSSAGSAVGTFQRQERGANGT